MAEIHLEVKKGCFLVPSCSDIRSLVVILGGHGAREYVPEPEDRPIFRSGRFCIAQVFWTRVIGAQVANRTVLAALLRPLEITCECLTS